VHLYLFIRCCILYLCNIEKEKKRKKKKTVQKFIKNILREFTPLAIHLGWRGGKNDQFMRHSEKMRMSNFVPKNINRIYNRAANIVDSKIGNP
jgi:hypothetical protein